jgi:hypothetical protein
MYGKCRDRMAHMHPSDRERLHVALKAGERDAIETHQAAVAALREVRTPFTILADTMSRACGA